MRVVAYVPTKLVNSVAHESNPNLEGDLLADETMGIVPHLGKDIETHPHNQITVRFYFDGEGGDYVEATFPKESIRTVAESV